MKYSIEIGKIVEGAIKNDHQKVKAYGEQLVKKLRKDGDDRAANKFDKILNMKSGMNLSPLNSNILNAMPVDSESHNKLADIIYPNEIEVDISLTGSNLEQINDFILNYEHADKLHDAGVGVSNSLLLYGPPGCGKTKTAYYIAKMIGLPLVIARLDSLISSYLGTTAKNIRNLFEYVQKMPCVLFLDEFDAIAKARDDSHELGELKRVVNSLLQNIDSMSKDSLIISATNHDQLLDTAVWRRFDYKIWIELPDLISIQELIKIYLGGIELPDDDIVAFATVFKGLSGATIEELVKKGLRDSIIHSRIFSQSDIYNEYFIFREIVSSNGEVDKTVKVNRAKHLREMDEKVFSYARIADILGVSKGYISKMIKEE